MKKFCSSKALLKMAGGEYAAMHPPLWIRP